MVTAASTPRHPGRPDSHDLSGNGRMPCGSGPLSGCSGIPKRSTMEAKCGINNAPTFGGTGIARGSSGIIGRSGQLVPFPRTATIVPNRLNHIIQEHTKGIRGKGQFASGANPSAIQGLINTTLSRGSLNRKPQGALRLCMNMILAILSVRVDGVVSRVLRSAS